MVHLTSHLTFNALFASPTKLLKPDFDSSYTDDVFGAYFKIISRILG